MKIAIAAFNIEKVSNSKYYNSQQEGLGKALASLGFDVTVYHFVSINEEASSSDLLIPSQNLQTKHLRSRIVPCKARGVHAVPDTNVWEDDIDLLIAFSDKSLGFPKTYKHFKKRGIPIIPYIGVIRSHNPSRIKRFISNLLPNNLRYYREISKVPSTPVLAKTVTMAEELRSAHISNCITLPVGLDEDLLTFDYKTKATKEALRSKYGYRADDKIFLFIGRLTAEKQPLTMLDIFASAVAFANTNHLSMPKCIMVGKGELQNEIDAYLDRRPELSELITRYSTFPNQDIWELYRISDAYINLNQQEIFGMSILEAMYYECPVIAYHAPGPDSIIADHLGILCHTKEALRETITNFLLPDASTDTSSAKQLYTSLAHRRIEEHYLWTSSAGRIATIANHLSVR